MEIRYIKKPYHTVSYLLKTNYKELLIFLDQYFSPFIYKKLEVKDPFVIEVLHNGNQSVIIANGKKYINDTSDIVQEINNIIYTTSSVEKHILPIHAATIAKKKSAYLFLGSTKAGKSTLVSYLCVKKKYKCIGDDAIMIDKETLSILKYSKPIMLRPDSVEILKKKAVILEDTINLKWGNVDRCYVYNNGIETKDYKIKGIFSIKRGSTNRIKKYDKSKAFNLLLKSLLYSENLSVDLLNSIKKLSLIDCYQLIYSDMDYVDEVINGL